LVVGEVNSFTDLYSVFALFDIFLKQFSPNSLFFSRIRKIFHEIGAKPGAG